MVVAKFILASTEKYEKRTEKTRPKLDSRHAAGLALPVLPMFSSFAVCSQTPSSYFSRPWMFSTSNKRVAELRLR